MAWRYTQPGLTRWRRLLMPHRPSCSDTVVFNSWRLDFAALRICSWLLLPRFLPQQPVSVLVCSSRAALWAARENSSMRWKETLPPALNIWRSGFGFSLGRSCWPLFGRKFQYFMIHGILFFPQQFTGLSWGNCQVWRFCKCSEGFYFMAERQFDGLVQKELRFTQLDCLFLLGLFCFVLFCYARNERGLYC